MWKFRKKDLLADQEKFRFLEMWKKGPKDWPQRERSRDQGAYQWPPKDRWVDQGRYRYLRMKLLKRPLRGRLADQEKSRFLRTWASRQRERLAGPRKCQEVKQQRPLPREEDQAGQGNTHRKAQAIVL
mmetsp:Transcript_13312/g.25360  ORF Transcript_13312/g.25360 Transcript_13312/m.25360 type:complete len:128 (-) Transcript_13312:814-1197(-)